MKKAHQAFINIKYKRLHTFVFIFVAGLLIWLSMPLIRAVVNGSYTQGEIVQTHTTISHYSSSSARTNTQANSSSQSFLNEITVAYEVENKPYTLRINIHVLSYLRSFSEGEKVTVYFDPNNPKASNVADYGAYSPAALILVYLAIALILGWVFQFVRQLIKLKGG